jgi:AraC-like DNA-binding protein
MKQDNEAYNQAHGSEAVKVPASGPLPPPNGARSEGARRVEQCIAYMLQHLNQPLQVAKLAQAAHTSSSHFFVLFKRWAGSSPIDYFIRLRMEQACRMLATTTLSVKEIATDLGYEDPFYFSRLFKSVHGIAPSDYRQMLDQPEDKAGGIARPRPVSELFNHKGGSERTRREKDRLVPAGPEIYMLQRG